jgi:hypothetical protein
MKILHDNYARINPSLVDLNFSMVSNCKMTGAHSHLRVCGLEVM